ncbi:uncharacterized protein LOC115440268 [Manduca sexta]|uniref:uncharacterized protein LOC115440268 n=1 Tax=Manduca sexta TaxID=7130 RepID=UPI001183CF9E|nr:uncharacterized protein LOC115440268 [Manduca sexta]
MDVSVQTCNGPNIVNRSYEESYQPLNNLINSSLTLQFGNKSNCDSDALEAVKLDPAVLEAQITVDTVNNKKESLAHKDDQSQRQTSFEKVVSMQEAALLSLEPEQFEFLMKYADALRRKRLSFQKSMECAFCKNNGESLSWYSSHALKDDRGRVRCPVLRGFRCPRCGATGDRAHTIKYCPENETDI